MVEQGLKDVETFHLTPGLIPTIGTGAHWNIHQSLNEPFSKYTRHLHELQDCVPDLGRKCYLSKMVGDAAHTINTACGTNITTKEER